MANLHRLLLSGRGFWVLLLSGVFFAAPASAQGVGDDEDAADEGPIEEVVTTGSRIRRDTFSTTTPIQVLDTEDAARIGIASISELMQKSTAVSGQKIDGSLNANAGQTNASEAPPDGGVGSSCVNLRGLGCERTLVLVNGKRLGLSGIRGAPPQPDINILPIGMVEAVDVLTGGLSTIYGADAVAGVVNVRLKRDFEGLTFTGTTEQTEHEGGEIYQMGLTAGVGSDLGNITLGMEYSRQERVTTRDRAFSQCLRRSNYGMSQNEAGERITHCSSDFPDNWLFLAGDWSDVATYNGPALDQPFGDGRDFNRLIYTPGSSDLILTATGQPLTNLSTFAVLPDTTAGLNGLRPLPDATDGGNPFYYNRFRHSRYNGNDQYDREIADLWRPYERFSLVVNGHLDPGWGNNTEAYMEGYYFNRQNDVIAAQEQIFPTILGQVPLVDENDQQLVDAGGNLVFVQNPLNPLGFDASPIITLDDVPQTFDTELQQVRLVFGLMGDIGSGGNWGYDVSASYDRATGHVSQPILLENQLFFATQTVRVVADENGNPTNNVICGPTVASDINGQFTQPPCVPADFLAASIGGVPGQSSGSFATQAERDYLVANRTNRTVTELAQVMAYITGDLFEVPGGGMVGTAFGAEFREDKIDSQNSAAGVLGLNAAENPLQEGETRGSRTTFDVYGEISAPVIVDRSWANLVQLDAAIRFTDDENFGDETVYKLGALWDINDYLSVSAAFNTSFRAPNLREQFLADQAGALPGQNDPCYNVTFNEIVEGPFKELLRANCLQSGVDPTTLGVGFTVAIPTSTGGALGLNPETSESFTATISASQPWTDRFGFDVALTFFDIQIEDTVRALDPGTISSKCYFSQPNLSSPFCQFVERDRPNAPANQNFISFIRAGFVNTGTETAQGYDLTTRLTADWGPASIIWTTGATFLAERQGQDFPPSEELPNGSAIIDNVGRIGNPELTFQSTLGVSFGAWDVVWQARWWDDTEFPQDVPNPVITDVDGNIYGTDTDPSDVYGDEFTEYRFAGSSLIDPAFGPVRPVTAAEGQMHHDLSLTYNLENFSFTAGINNLTDEEPPLISQQAGPNRNNAVTSARYDVVGRSYFLRLTAGF